MLSIRKIVDYKKSITYQSLLQILPDVRGISSLENLPDVRGISPLENLLFLRLIRLLQLLTSRHLSLPRVPLLKHIVLRQRWYSHLLV
ncbi:MAG: hypothetical protein WBF90_05835, partial [Rivularia sp. (in: cyanobacteria)]